MLKRLKCHPSLSNIFKVFLINTSNAFIMDIEKQQWDLADQELNLWLNGDNNGSNLQLAEILKSIYLAFRQKQIERLSPFCKHAFEYYQKQELERKIEKESFYDLLKIVSEETHEIEEDNIPMFKKSSRSFFYIDDWTRKNNDKIINGIVAGNHEVLNDLYEYEFPKVVNLIIKNYGNVEMAQDVFQDAIVILMEKVYAKKLDLTCSVETYLFSICKYLWLDQLRQNKKEMQMIKFYDEEFQTDDISVFFYNTPDIYEVVNRAIESIGDPCKLLLECFYYKNMSFDEIASSLGYANAASARNQKYKCLERIRSVLNVEVE